VKHPARRFVFVTLFMLFALNLISCGPQKDKFSSGSPRAFLLPWPTPQGAYRLQRVELETFSQPRRLRGEVGQILIDPHEVDAELVAARSVGRFTLLSDSTAVPVDLLSLQATVIYAHLEGLYKLDRFLGLQTENVWPAKVGLEVQADRPMHNNAIYSSRLRSLLLVPYTESQLPIALNAGVLAHEHFHALFHSLLLRPLIRSKKVTDESMRLISPDQHDFCHLHQGPQIDVKPNPDSDTKKLERPIRPHVFNNFVLRAMNEGIADFWGWLYVGDANFIMRSLPRIQDLRALDVEVQRFPTARQFSVTMRQTKDDREMIALAYLLGTYYSRFLAQLANAQDAQRGPGQESDLFLRQTEIASAVIRALKTMTAKFEQKFSDEMIAPETFLMAVFDELSAVSRESCDLLAKSIPEAAEIEFVVRGHEKKPPQPAHPKCAEYLQTKTADSSSTPSTPPAKDKAVIKLGPVKKVDLGGGGFIHRAEKK